MITWYDAINQQPGRLSLRLFWYAVAFIMADIFLWLRPIKERREYFVRLTSNPRTSRIIYACIYVCLAILSVSLVMWYQYEYFDTLERLGLRDRRDLPTSTYSNFFEEYMHYTPLMFTMIHLRAWAGEANSQLPEWANFFWWSQQYLAGLMTFSFFLLIQSRVRRINFVTMFAFIYIAMTSLSFALCLFFFFVLVTPPGRHQERFRPKIMHSIIGCISIAQHLAAAAMMYNLNTSIYQMYLLWAGILPLTMALLVLILPTVKSFQLGFVSIHEAQVRVYFTSAVSSLVLHLYTTYVVLFKPFTNAPEDAMNRLYVNQPDFVARLKTFGVKGLHGDDASLIAITWDVLLSFLAIFVWVAVTATSPQGILRCSMSPWVRSYQMPLWDGMSDIVVQGFSRQEMLNVAYPRFRDLDYRDYETDELFIQAWQARAADDRAFERYRDRILTPADPPHHLALTLFLAIVGGLGYAAAGALGAGPTRLFLI